MKRLAVRYKGAENPTTEPSTWGAVMMGKPPYYTASVTCPYGHYSTLEDYIVHTHGLVEPTFVCSGPGVVCNFRDDLVLDKWIGVLLVPTKTRAVQLTLMEIRFLAAVVRNAAVDPEYADVKNAVEQKLR